LSVHQGEGASGGGCTDLDREHEPRQIVVSIDVLKSLKCNGPRALSLGNHKDRLLGEVDLQNSTRLTVKQGAGGCVCGRMGMGGWMKEFADRVHTAVCGSAAKSMLKITLTRERVCVCTSGNLVGREEKWRVRVCAPVSRSLKFAERQNCTRFATGAQMEISPHPHRRHPRCHRCAY
jgi:hypothetical protein